MSFVDHESSFQVDFPRDIVFKAASDALKENKLFKVKEVDSVLHTIRLSAGMSLFSWGESITINIKEKDSQTTEISIVSTPITGALFGGTMDMGKNRRNIEAIMKCISLALQNISVASHQLQSSSSRTTGNLQSQTQPLSVIHEPETQTFIFECPFCSIKLECSLELENTSCQCPKCGQEIFPSRDV